MIRVVLLCFAGWGLTGVVQAGQAGTSGNLLAEARSAFYRGDPEQARSLSMAYLRIHSTAAEGRILLARALAALGRPEEAMRELEKILEREPNHPDALFYLAGLAESLAQAEYGRLYRLNPESARVHQLMARSLELQQKYQESRAEYEAALRVNPELTEVWTGLGDLLRTTGEFAAAEEKYREALKRNPRDYLALYGVGVCLRSGQRHQEALDYFRASRESAPGYAPAYLAEGMSLQELGDGEQAIVVLQEAIRLQPDMDQAYYQLGRAYQTLGRIEEAKQALEQARILRLKNLTRFR
ncbi:MAG: hypothetical protein Kow001_16860 [Acidobacteriota bacterium]